MSPRGVYERSPEHRELKRAIRLRELQPVNDGTSPVAVVPGGGSGAVAAPDARTCPPHHWLLSSPDGSGTCEGVCRKCKAKRTYNAGEQPAVWGTPR